MNRAAFAVSRGLPWVATNTDLTIPVPGGIAPGNGTLVAAVATATGRAPEVAGKPFPPILLWAADLSAGLRPLVVGDRLDTDVIAGHRAGMLTAMVLTGVSTREEAAVAAIAPDLIANDLPSITAALVG